MTCRTGGSDVVDKLALVAAGLALIDLGYHLNVTTGCKGNRPYLPEWQAYPIPAADWAEFIGFPRTTGIGALTAGLAVIDIDGSEGLENWKVFIDQHDLDPAPFRQQMVSTPGGGYHLYLRDPDQTVTNAGGLLGPINKIDVRGTGGFITMPPTQRPGTAGYQWRAGPLPIDHLPEAPPWMSGTLRRSNTGELALYDAGGEREPKLTEWGKEEVTRLAMRIAEEESGGRHRVLFVSAVAIGHLIAEGKTTLAYAYESLDSAALAAGLHAEGRENEVNRTILDGFAAAFSRRRVGLEALIDKVEAAR